MTREQRFLPNGIPRYVRCYDDPTSGDRFTVVFTGRYQGRDGCDYLGMNSYPFHPQGIGQHGWSRDVIDYPTYGHLGKKIKFTDLPKDCQQCVLQSYKEIWRIK